MSTATPRLRMFAGPNGSGKSTIKARVEEIIGSESLGVYVNADDIELEINHSGFLDLPSYGVTATEEAVLGFFRESTFLAEEGLADEAAKLTFEEGKLSFAAVKMNSYLASVAVDFLRQNLLQSRVTFTFETVMSHRSKVDFLRLARSHGFRTYLYFVATEDPEINIARVKNRVEEGGHNVNVEKVVARYHRSLDLLAEAVQHASRAYIFDNSSDEKIWVAEVTEGDILELKTDMMPVWFKDALWDKFE